MHKRKRSVLTQTSMSDECWHICWTTVSDLMCKYEPAMMAELSIELVELTQMRRDARRYEDTSGEAELVAYYDRQVCDIIEQRRSQQLAKVELMLEALYAECSQLGSDEVSVDAGWHRNGIRRMNTLLKRNQTRFICHQIIFDSNQIQ